MATVTPCQQLVSLAVIVSARRFSACSHPFPCFLQDDKDLVHEFVVAEGLTCLIKVGAEADQNYQNYILRGTSPPRARAHARSCCDSPPPPEITASR